MNERTGEKEIEEKGGRGDNGIKGKQRIKKFHFSTKSSFNARVTTSPVPNV